jgi:hypothetical protein
MPYFVKKFGEKKYKVCKVDNPNECFSKEGLSKEKAEAQKVAIGISERKSGGGIDDAFTISQFEKFNVGELKNIVRKYNLHTNIKMSGIKKSELVDRMVEHLYIDGNVLKNKANFERKVPISKKDTKFYQKLNKNFERLPDEIKKNASEELLKILEKLNK